MPTAKSQSLTGDLLDVLDRTPGTQDREVSALHLLDWLGCAIAGAATPVGRAMAIAADAPGHPLGEAGQGRAQVAFRYGSFGSLLEMDDVHRTAILHPGPAVMPAVLACTTPATAGRAAEAILRGYDAMVRLGVSVGVDHYRHFHNSATCGGLGSAVAAAWMLGLDRTTTQWAMAHALSTSGGLWECRNEPGATKHLHVAEAARRGVQAALSAQAGLAGPLRILEGAQGFYAGLAPGGDPGVLTAPGPWTIYDTSFKPWPACRHAHAVIDAALSLRPALAGRIPDRIDIACYADAVLFCDRPVPGDPAAARFSLQHAVAVALTDGPPSLEAFEDPALATPAYARLRRLTTVAEDGDLTARYPAHFGGRVTLRIGDEVLTRTVPDAWGDAENPMAAADVTRKYRALADWAKTPAALRDALQDAALDPSGAANLRRLLATLSPVSDHSSFSSRT